VNTISLAALTTAGTPLTQGTNAFQFDFTGADLRPTVMHDSVAGDPMWFVQAGANNASVNVVEMTNPLSTTASFTSNPLGVKQYSPAVPMLQPIGSAITGVTSGIQKVAEYNNVLVAAQAVSDAAGDGDNIQWYAIDVSSGQPQMQQQGDVSGGPGVYDAFPSIDINKNGDIGMTFSQSGRAGPFLAVGVTGRVAGDSLGTMRNPVITQVGLQNYHGDLLGSQNPIGPVSGINVDSDGSFWVVNQYADLETFTNWGTAIAHFTIPASTVPVQTVTMNQTTFTTSAVVAGAGGAGGSAGLGSDDGRNHGINGQGGNGGTAQGGTVYLSSTAAQSATLSAVSVTSSSARAGAGGAGAINTLGTDNVTFYYRGRFGLKGSQFGWNGFGSSGGNGGSVKGVGLAAVNYALNLIPPATGTGTVSFNGGIGIAGSGGNGGGATAVLPRSWDGGAGGNGGSVQGGAVFMSNNLASPALNLTFNGGTASNYTLTAGIAGSGGNAGASTTLAHRSNVQGGVGGLGGNAQGGGIYVFAGSKSINNVSFNNVSVLNDHITAGTGGQGGAGFNATGGMGGIAMGGGFFNTSLNGGQTSSLFISNSTVAGDDATGGNGGNAGSGTTPNGGAGGVGGSAGNADGGGLFNGQNTPMTVINSTFGGGSVNGTSGNANILTSGLGGRGGNAGTPAGVVRNNGGNGGNGGSVAGGNVYNSSTGAVFTNDTVVQGQASIFGLGGAGGSGAGSGGLTGNPGGTGTGIAGGYFAAAASSSNTLGNTILAFNSAAANSDAAGSFTSKGGNILSSTVAGFNTGSGGGDVMVTTAYSANLGPLLNNGGPAPTDAVLPGSKAIGAGKLALLTTPPFSANPLDGNQVDDQRGTGFVRAFQGVVSSGAFEFLPPTITSLSPSAVVEGSPSLSLSVFGANFASGATVTFGTTQLTPSSSSATKLVVGVPSNLLTTPGVVQVFVNVPDGSGIAGHTETSLPANFTIQATPFTLVNPGSQQGYEGGQFNLQIKPATGFSATGFTDLVGAQDTLPPGLTIDANTGIISGTVASGASAKSPYTVTISATDNNGDPASVTFQFKVLGPLFLNPVPPQTSNEGDKVTLQISAPPGYNPSGFQATGLPPGLSINTTTGLISGTIDPRGAGSYVVTVTPTNNNGKGGILFDWTVNDSNAPTLTNPGTQKTPAGVDVNLQIQAVDADKGSWTATGLPPGLLIDANGVIFGTIAASAQGVYAVTVQSADGPVQSAPVSFFWFVSGAASPPPSATPAPGSLPPGIQGVGTSTSIVNVSNQYQGFVQLETVTVDVSSAGGFTVNEGVVAISVDGQTAFAPVHNGVATATFATGLFDLGLLPDLIFTHPLTASYSDSAGTFASSGANTTLPAIWIDFLLTMLAIDLGQLNQVQG
jgi:hypothetical protein